MEERIKAVFAGQRKHKFDLRKTNAKTRILKLKKLKVALERSETEIYNALEKDLRKSRFEAAVTELYFVYAEIDHAIKNLKKWMRPKSVSRTLSNPFSRNRIYYEPKGVCLIIAPWNYPLQLTISPLISAIAAGNCVILKPSELSASTATVIHSLISKTFQQDEIACFEGDAKISMMLLKLPFDHIFFTGSTAVGKVVMEAAAKNLTSVTLELGGKSPVIVDDTADLKKAAEKIAWGKLVNSGQTCIAPDYLLIDERKEAEFLGYFKQATEKMFFLDGKVNEAVYGRIINLKQFERLQGLIEKSQQEGLKVAWGGGYDVKSMTILPTLITEVGATHTIMQEEIFGPILPIVRYTKLQEAIDLIHSKDKPLALYVFSKNKENINKILSETSAGGTCINDVLIHISNPNLPFGGVNTSGMGSSHGIFGFKSFSHERAVVFQSKLGTTQLIYPPYAKKESLLKWLKKLM